MFRWNADARVDDVNENPNPVPGLRFDAPVLTVIVPPSFMDSMALMAGSGTPAQPVGVRTDGRVLRAENVFQAMCLRAISFFSRERVVEREFMEIEFLDLEGDWPHEVEDFPDQVLDPVDLPADVFQLRLRASALPGFRSRFWTVV